MNRFEYTDGDGGRLTVQPLPGVPYIVLTTSPEDASIPLDRVEEVITGMRDMARQAGGQSAPAPRRLTELEHDRAWHAIEGTTSEDGADPGTVLAAVLHALGIDPPRPAEALARTTTAPPPGCPAKHGAHGRVCELADGHPGAHMGSIPGGHVSWHGDADGWE